MQLYEHPDYKSEKDKFALYRDLFKGDHGTLSDTHLWPFEIELSEAGKKANLLPGRKRRSRYTNLCRLLFDVVNGLYFRVEPNIGKNVEKMLGDEIDDIDGKGNSLTTFIKDLAQKSDFIYGRVFILADAFGISADNLAQERELRIRPYLTCLDPLQVRDWQRESGKPERLNRLNLLRYNESVIAPRASASDEPKIAEYSKAYVRTPEGVFIDVYRREEEKSSQQKSAERSKKQEDQNWELIETIPIESDEIPIAVAEGESWLEAPSEIALRHYNMESALDNVLYYAGFPIRWASGFNHGDASTEIQFSESNLWLIPDGGRAGIVEPSDPIGIEKRLRDTRDLFFKVGLKHTKQLASDSKAAQSGDSRREEKDNLIAVIQSRLENLEQVVNTALEHYAAFKGEENFDSDLKLASDISTDEINEVLTAYGILKEDLRQLPEHKKAFIRKIAKRAQLEGGEDLEKEIEGASFDGPRQRISDRLRDLSGDGER